MFRKGLLYLEVDIILDCYLCLMEGLDGIGVGVIIFYLDGNIVGFSCDYLYVK